MGVLTHFTWLEVVNGARGPQAELSCRGLGTGGKKSVGDQEMATWGAFTVQSSAFAHFR